MSDSKKPNLMARPLIDLREMLERENKLLANKRFIERLKDKGEKIRRFRDEIDCAIQIKQSMEETETFLARLNLGEKAILPKHPLFSANSQDMKLAKQTTNSKQPNSGKEVVKELLTGDLDIYSVALSNTFDEQLSQQRAERFVLNRIPKSVRKQVDKSEKSDQSDKSESASSEAKLERAKKVDVAEKYRDTALEVYNGGEKLVALSIENSLEVGKEQKLRDFEVDKLKLENRLTWRAISEFDSDESSAEETGDEEGMDDAD